MRMKSINHLSPKALEELYRNYTYDTKKYRYIYRPDQDKIYRVEQNIVGTTSILNPENWVEQ